MRKCVDDPRRALRVAEEGRSTSRLARSKSGAVHVRFMIAHLVTLATKQTAMRYIVLNLWVVFAYCVSLFSYDLLSDDVSSAYYVASCNRMIE
jgi:hypothetical protein